MAEKLSYPNSQINSLSYWNTTQSLGLRIAIRIKSSTGRDLEMNRILIVIIVSIVLSTAKQSWALDQELLLPLTGDELNRAQEENEYYIRKHTFDAKRYRLVKVNADALLSGEDIRITLFEDDTLIASSTLVEVDERTDAIRWKGNVNHPTLRPESLLDKYGSIEAAQTVYNALMGVEFFGFPNELDQATGFNFEIQVDPMELLQSNAGPIDSASRNDNQFYGITSNFSPNTLRGSYSLHLLGRGGAFHILTERDESKTYKRDDHGNIDLTDPGTAQLWSDYQEHKADLGPDPKEELLEERLRNAGLLLEISADDLEALKNTKRN